MSVLMTATRGLLRLRGGRGRGSPAGDLLELAGRTYPEPAPVPSALRKVFDVTRPTIGGIPVIRLTPRSGASGRHVIYTHGGAYVRPLIPPHWQILARATRGTGATVTVPLYRLAPEGCVDDAYPALRAVYQDVLTGTAAQDITLAGDSAGGGLALGQACDHRTHGLPAAARIVLFAPWLDVTLVDPGIPELERADPMLSAGLLRGAGRLWARGRDLRDPLVSPLYGDVAGLPPVHLFQGGYDILAADARTLDERLRQAGNTGTTTWAPDGFHVYVGATWTSEARAALAAVRALISA